MNTISKFLAAILFTASVSFLGSCKKEFDSPPGPSDPQIVANTSIADLKARHTVFGAYDVITDDIIISGIVIADDKSGNLYKQLYVRDSTGAIQILLDAASLYGNYPVGRKLFIKCKGLCISDYNRMIELGVKTDVAGAPSVEAIPSNTISNYVIGGTINNPVAPKLVTIADLGATNVSMQNPLLGDLIQLNDYEFVNPMNTYSDTSAYKSDRNDTLKNCDGKTIIMRTSGYSRFAGARVKQGNGNIAAIYTVFQSGTSGTKQLLLRDTTDITFNNPRCGAPPVGSVVYIDENFETQPYVVSTPQTYSDVSITGWQNAPETGTRKYSARQFSGSKYAYLSAFGAGGTIKTWLVTKAITRTTATTTLSFETKQDFYLSTAPGGFPVPASLKVLTSTDYTGTGNPWAATWTDLTSQAALSPGSTTGNFPSSSTPSGNISLNGTGVIYVAFVYEGVDDPSSTTQVTDKTSAWEIDNIRVLGL